MPADKLMTERLDKWRNRLTRDWRSVQRRIRTRSVFVLQLGGFLIAALPLVIALIVSSQLIGKVTRDSEQLLQRSLVLTQSARELNDRVIALERAARQYRILQDVPASETLAQRKQGFENDLRGLTDQINDRNLEQKAVQMHAKLEEVVAEAIELKSDEIWPRSVASAFLELSDMAGELVLRAEQVAEQESRELATRGEDARKLSLAALLTTVPLTVVLATLMARAINRPIRALDHAMRGLNRRNSEAIQQIASPRDLRALSVRLEWLRRRLERTERARQRLIGEVSHELKTPLASISEGFNLLKDQSYGKLGNEQHEVLTIIGSSIDRLKGQIDNLLRLNRLQAGAKPVLGSSVQLGELIDKTLSEHQFALQARDLKIERRVDRQITVTADPGMVSTILDNLLSNAIKFSSHGQTIALALEQQGDNAVFRIADNGCGIRPADRQRLFEPFFRGRSSISTTTPGSGLGLAISRDLARAHGGDIYFVESAHWATIFEVILPSYPDLGED